MDFDERVTTISSRSADVAMEMSVSGGKVTLAISEAKERLKTRRIKSRKVKQQQKEEDQHNNQGQHNIFRDESQWLLFFLLQHGR